MLCIIIYRNIDSESLPHFLNKSLTYFCKTGEKRDGTDVIYIWQYNPRIKAVLAAIIGGCASERLGWVSGTVCLHRAAAVADQLCAVTITGPADLSCSQQSAVEWAREGAHGRSVWSALRSVLLLPFGYFRSFVFVSLFFIFIMIIISNDLFVSLDFWINLFKDPLRKSVVNERVFNLCKLLFSVSYLCYFKF